jgi:hypothetical protein
VLEGHGRFDYLNGDIYEGEWSENKRHGQGKLIEADGTAIFTGKWDNDLKHGKGSFMQKS